MDFYYAKTILHNINELGHQISSPVNFHSSHACMFYINHFSTSHFNHNINCILFCLYYLKLIFQVRFCKIIVWFLLDLSMITHPDSYVENVEVATSIRKIWIPILKTIATHQATMSALNALIKVVEETESRNIIYVCTVIDKSHIRIYQWITSLFYCWIKTPKFVICDNY